MGDIWFGPVAGRNPERHALRRSENVLTESRASETSAGHVGARPKGAS